MAKDKFVKNRCDNVIYGKDRSAIEESILETARSLLQDRKYRTTSVISLSRQAGVSRSSFYRCFRNKEDVLCRLLQRELTSPCSNERGISPENQDFLQELLVKETKDSHFKKIFPWKSTQLQTWFYNLQSHDAVLELYYTNGYSELAREQIINLYAAPFEDSARCYRKIFEAGGTLSLYEAWKRGILKK